MSIRFGLKRMLSGDNFRAAEQIFRRIAVKLSFKCLRLSRVADIFAWEVLVALAAADRQQYPLYQILTARLTAVRSLQQPYGQANDMMRWLKRGPSPSEISKVHNPVSNGELLDAVR